MVDGGGWGWLVVRGEGAFYNGGDESQKQEVVAMHGGWWWMGLVGGAWGRGFL